MKLLNLKKSTERGSLIIYAFLAVIILGAIAGVSTYVTHNVQTTQRRQSYGEAYNYSEAGLMLAAADVNSAFTNASSSFLETLTGSNLAPYKKDADRSTYNTLVYARTITSPFTNQPVEIELSIPNETEPSKVSITSRAYVRGVAVTNTAVVDLTFAYRAVIVSDHVGSSSGTVSEANAMLGNVVLPTASQGSPLTVDGRIIANGRVNVGSIGLGSEYISMTNYGTAKEVPNYTKSGSTDQLFDFKRIIKASDLLGTHYASIDAFIRAAKKEEVFEGIIVVDVRREEDKDDGKTDKDDSKSDKDDSKSDKDDSKSDKDDSKSDKDDSKSDKDDSKSDKDDSKSDKDDDDGKDDKDDPGIDRVDLPKGIYVRGTLVFNYVFDAIKSDDKDDSKSDKDDSKSDKDDSKSDKDDSKSDKDGKDNNGHGNNVDGVDSSNPGKSKPEDPSGSVDDEKKGKVTKSSSMSDKDDAKTDKDDSKSDKDDSKSDKDDSKSDKDDSKSDKDDGKSDKDDGKSDKDDGDDGKSDPGEGYVAWDDANDVLDGVALYINWIDLDTLDAANPNTYTSAYPPTFANPEFNPTSLNMVAFGYENFAVGEDLPALMFNGGSMRLSGLLDICGVVYSPNYIDIQNDGATTQYIKGTVFGGGGVYIENNTSGSRTILSFDSRAVDNLATKYNRGMNVAVKHRD